MPFELNAKIRNLSPYEPGQAKARIRLDANESFLSLPDDVMADIRACVDALHFNRYPDPSAADLCRAAAAWYGVPADCVTAGNGSDELTSILFSAFLQKGDRVLCFEPDFSMYAFYGYLAESVCIRAKKRPDYTIDIQAAIETARAEKASMVIFSNPCNPTSVGMSEQEVLEIVRSVDALVVVDEAYMDFYGRSILPRLAEFENLVVLRTMSKAMGLAAARIGFAFASPSVTRALKSAKSPYNVNALSQAIGAAVFRKPEAITHSVNLIKSSRDMLWQEFGRLARAFPDQLRPVAADANFVYTETAQCEKLFGHLLSSGILVRRFGDCLRVTAGRNLENVELIAAVESFCSSSNGGGDILCAAPK